MHIQDQAENAPNATAISMDDGRRMSWRELNNASIALANELVSVNIQPGQTIALIMENRPEYFVATWAAMRLGLYLVPVNWHLKADEIAYIVSDSQASLVLHSSEMRVLAQSLSSSAPLLDIDTGEAHAALRQAVSGSHKVLPNYVEAEGQIMYYSSGTTGRPKGIKRAIGERAFGESAPIDAFLQQTYGVGEATVYLSPAPQYHAAPLNWCMAILRLGGQVVVMARFDALQALRLIEQHRVTHAQFVPTMFVRMLKLSAVVRDSIDVTSLQMAVHAAAPCPVNVKQQMMAWWGPILHEYYGGSEGNGATAIGPDEWLARPGSVGRAVMGELHITTENGDPLPAGETGTVCFSGLPDFEYYRDPEKTRKAYMRPGLSTLGDIGHVDDDGFLYLSDRKAFTIISGGVNIYPQEIENILVDKPEILDAAVLGVPDEEFGERVVAVVQLQEGVSESDMLKSAILDFCRENLAAYKCPRQILFDHALPRMPNGKLLKRLINVEELLQTDAIKS